MFPRRCFAILVLSASAAIFGQTPIVAPPMRVPPREIIDERSPDAIPGQFIIVFRAGATPSDHAAAEEHVAKAGGRILLRYTAALKGFSVRMPLEAVPALRNLLLNVPAVAWIEADKKMSIDSTTQINPPKGLDRTDHRLLGLNNKYIYSENGTGVNVYVIDTGILATHNDFGGRASGAGFTAINDGNGTKDCNGHGTHVAGTIGGTTYGVAKQASLHAVRVLDCSGNGTVSTVIAGVNWVTLNRVLPAVANMSVGGSSSVSLDTAVTNSIAANVTYVVAAGNSNSNACTTSPAETPNAITVGATDPTNDARASFSNWGPCLDLFAPGVGILSAWFSPGTNATNTLSGTSMAAPHVSGVAALYLQYHSGASPAAVLAAIHNADDVSTTPLWPGVINRGTGSPNELLHWGAYNTGFDDGDTHLPLSTALAAASARRARSR